MRVTLGIASLVAIIAGIYGSQKASSAVGIGLDCNLKSELTSVSWASLIAGGLVLGIVIFWKRLI